MTVSSCPVQPSSKMGCPVNSTPTSLVAVAHDCDNEPSENIIQQAMSVLAQLNLVVLRRGYVAASTKLAGKR
jgi:hypothetical protein